MNVIGSGGFASEIIAYHINVREFGSSPIFTYVEPKYIKGAEKDINTISGFCMLGVGDPHLKKRLVETYASKCIFPPKVFGLYYTNSKTEGLIVCPNAVVTKNVKLGKHVHVNLCATIGHDCVIGDYVTINPSANVSGNVTIGNLCTIGTGAAIKEKITICDNVVIGAGAVVVKDITEAGVYVGNPAKCLRKFV